MPVDPTAPITVSAYNWVPDFARGLVRDLRVRWALEEAGRDYAVRLLDARAERPADYLLEQPFGQVPAYTDPEVQLFESGAIVLHIGETSEALLPGDVAGKARATAWLIAALNSVEHVVQMRTGIDAFYAGQTWTEGYRPIVEGQVMRRLGQVSTWFGDRDWLEDRFTAGDLMMITVLRILRHTDILGRFPNLAAYQARGEARPAFQRALDAQMADFDELAAA